MPEASGAAGIDTGQQQQVPNTSPAGTGYVSDKEYADDISKHLMAIKGLSIVGK